MSTRIVQVDAFTEEPFTGNPAAICVLPEARNAIWMQHVASEMNLSETAFLVRRKNGEGAFDLRWFTPGTEVDLCGHATLASAHVLWEENHLAADIPAHFFTKSGVLTAKRDGAWIEMDFPAEAEERAPMPKALRQMLPADPLCVGKNRMDYIIELADEEAVRTLEPDFSLLDQVDARGIIVTAASTGSSYDFVSRFFAPAVGVPEDPVTGSAHCCLGPYWQKRLGKEDLIGYQASARGGIVRVSPRGDRVIISGKAVTVLRGELLA